MLMKQSTLQVHIDDESVVGTPLYVVLYENSLTDPNADPIYLTQSDDYILTQNDLDSWITVPFDGGQDLYAGSTSYGLVGGYTLSSGYFQGKCIG